MQSDIYLVRDMCIPSRQFYIFNHLFHSLNTTSYQTHKLYLLLIPPVQAIKT